MFLNLNIALQSRGTKNMKDHVVRLDNIRACTINIFALNLVVISASKVTEIKLWKVQNYANFIVFELCLILICTILHIAQLCSRVWRILGYSNIFLYKYSFISYSIIFLIRIYSDICSYCFFLYRYIRISVRIIFLKRIYSDIRSYHFFETNIFGYSFVLFFFIRIYSRGKI